MTESRRMRRAGTVAVLASIGFATTARADTLDVPAEVATIQAAIDAAQPGDTVLVAPGTYVETIDFLGKAITVVSSGGAAVTTIDGNGAGSVVTFQSLEGKTSVLQGFTITGGTGSDYQGYEVGGGIKIVNAGPKLTDCHIVDNSARDFGGGIYVWQNVFTTIQISPLLTGCTIAGNTTTGPTIGVVSPGGGGIAVHRCDATLTACTISGNTTHGNGGGLATIEYGAYYPITKCVIQGNQAAGSGGGLDVRSSHFLNSWIDMTECIVRDNSAGGGGGGIQASLHSDTPFYASFMFISLTAVTGNTAASGGGIYVTTDYAGAVAGLSGSMITGNVAQSAGGALCSGRVSVDNCTIAGNQADNGGGLYAFLDNPGRVRGSIIWGNTGGDIAGTLSDALYSDIPGEIAGAGNIDVDPHFVDPAGGDYHLAPTSACVDAGDPAMTSSFGVDIDGDPRVLFGHIDIGADEATIPKSPWTFLGHALAGAGGEPSLTGTGPLTAGSDTTLSLDGAAQGSASWVVAGGDQLMQPFKGGVMVPTFDILVGPLGIDPTGSSVLDGRWPNGVPPGFTVTLQTWIADASGPSGLTASNALAAKSQ